MASTTCSIAGTLWIRSEKQHAILRVRHEVISAVRDFFNDQGFILADTPIFTPAACEGTTTLFPVDYFEDQKVFLTQSGQLYAEANAMALGRVYNFGPVFRAEKSKTRRHLTEFWMVEPEMAYATLDDVIDLAEGLVVAVVSRVLDKRQRELKALERDTSKLESVKSAVSSDLVRRGGQDSPGQGTAVRMGRRPWRHRRNDSVAAFRPAGGHPPVPSKVKPFYMEPDPQRPELALCVDMLAPEGIGEIIGGSQRLASYDVLLQRIKDHNLPQEAFEWYLDLRRFGSVPHAGFGMGIERVVGWICGLEHVREAIAVSADDVSGLLRIASSSELHQLPERFMKIGFVSLGCPKNLVDSEVMMGLSQEGGHTLTPNPPMPTCSSSTPARSSTRRKKNRSTPSSSSPSSRRTVTASASSSPAAWASAIATS